MSDHADQLDPSTEAENSCTTDRCSRWTDGNVSQPHQERLEENVEFLLTGNLLSNYRCSFKEGALRRRAHDGRRLPTSPAEPSALIPNASDRACFQA